MTSKENIIHRSQTSRPKSIFHSILLWFWFSSPLQVTLPTLGSVFCWDKVFQFYIFALRRYDMNGRFQMQGGKNWILPKEMNANRFLWDSHWLEIWSNHFCPSMGPNGGSVAMDSGQWSNQPQAREKEYYFVLSLNLLCRHGSPLQTIIGGYLLFGVLQILKKYVKWPLLSAE